MLTQRELLWEQLCAAEDAVQEASDLLPTSEEEAADPKAQELLRDALEAIERAQELNESSAIVSVDSGPSIAFADIRDAHAFADVLRAAGVVGVSVRC